MPSVAGHAVPHGRGAKGVSDEIAFVLRSRPTKPNTQLQKFKFRSVELINFWTVCAALHRPKEIRMNLKISKGKQIAVFGIFPAALEIWC